MYIVSQFLTGADFTAVPIIIEIPAAINDGAQEFELPTFFRVIDDDIDEVEQSFAIVAELGPDVTDTPFNFSCFQLRAGATACFGRCGATTIRITDNDRKRIELFRVVVPQIAHHGIIKVYVACYILHLSLLPSQGMVIILTSL